jgi:peptidoglycan hydrolase-like protein with peptidoglycan-binding domain
MDIRRASPEALRSTGRPAAARARHAPSPPVGFLRLQQTAGNAAVAGLVAARQVVTAPAPGGGPPTITTRPTLRLGDIDQQVGVAQQKLNVLGTTPELKIDAEFGSRTQIAVRTFQTANGVTASGVLDTATWTQLDARAPGGDLRPDGTVAPVPGLRPGDPSPQPRPGLATHPTLKLTARGPAVSELHEKLNALGVGGGLPVGRGLAGAAAITFDAATDTAVRAFQRAHPPLVADGQAGINTWAALDRLVPGAGAGRVQQKGVPDPARGKQFDTDSAFDWALEPDRSAPTRLAARVTYAFTNDPVRPVDKPAEVGKILAGIRRVWNVFAAVESPIPPAAARPPVDIDFQPTEATPADHTILLTKGTGPTDAAHFFLDGVADVTEAAAHEFGHHIGLPDEYQQTAADHLRQTGEAAPVGQVRGDADPVVIARELHAAVHGAPRSGRGDKALLVVEGHKLAQGAFAQQVARRYVVLFGVDVVNDINANVDESESEGSMTKQRKCTQPFLYTADNVMGGAETEQGPNALLVEPRHVRQFARIVAAALGGIWEPKRR